MSSPSATAGRTHDGARITPRRGGTALAIVGAALLGIGLFASTGASVQPVCPGGTKLVAKFDWTGSKYRFDQPKGNSGVVTLSSASATGGRFSSSQPIATVVVKGGPGSKDSWITPAATTGSFSNAGLPTTAGRTPNIDTVQFCVATAVNPAAAAAGFDVVTKGDAVLAANESEGPVAVGGDVRFDQYQVAGHSSGAFKVDPTDAAPTALLVRGKVGIKDSKGQLTVENGWVAIGNPAAVTAKRTNPNQIVVNRASAKPDVLPRILGQNSSQTIASATRKSAFDFDGAFTAWRTLAEGLLRCRGTVTLRGADSVNSPWTGGDGYIDPPGGAGQMVLQLTAADLSRLTSITFRPGAEPSATRPLVIDVAGIPSNWNPPNINGDADAFAPYILWNFGGASKVRITGSNQLVGTAFAPSGAFDQEGAGNLVGAVYAASFVHDGGGEVHDRPFATTVTPCSCTPPTTTTSTVAPTSSTTPSSTAYPTSSSTPTSSTTTSSTTTSTVYPTSSSTPTSSTTTSSSTTSSTTTSTVYPTSSSTPTSSTTTSSSTTSSTTTSTVYPTSSTPTSAPSSTTPSSSTTTESTTTTAVVEGTTVVATSITPDDNARVEGTSTSKGTGLAFTGSTSLPMVIIGALLLLAGITTVLVDRRRSRSTGYSQDI